MGIKEIISNASEKELDNILNKENSCKKFEAEVYSQVDGKTPYERNQQRNANKSIDLLINRGAVIQ